MIANYHTHTPRCRHAVGTEEEYVRGALDVGMKILGFSMPESKFLRKACGLKYGKKNHNEWTVLQICRRGL